MCNLYVPRHSTCLVSRTSIGFVGLMAIRTYRDKEIRSYSNKELSVDSIFIPPCHKDWLVTAMMSKVQTCTPKPRYGTIGTDLFQRVIRIWFAMGRSATATPQFCPLNVLSRSRSKASSSRVAQTGQIESTYFLRPSYPQWDMQYANEASTLLWAQDIWVGQTVGEGHRKWFKWKLTKLVDLHGA